MDNGFDAARVSTIARRAGLTSGAVYARWPTKSDVMVAALDYIFHKILPASRLKESGTDGLRSPELIETLGASLLETEESRDVLVQAFGSARNNAGIRECLLAFLNQEAQQLTDIVDEGKEGGFVDAGLSTAAMSLLCQGAAIGVQLLLAAGLDERYVPSEDEWNTLVTTLVRATAPTRP